VSQSRSNPHGSAARVRRKGRETKGAASPAVCLRDTGSVLVRDRLTPIASWYLSLERR